MTTPSMPAAHSEPPSAEALVVPNLYRSEGFAEDLIDDAQADWPAPWEHADAPSPWGRVGGWLSALPLAVTVLSAAASVLV